MAQGKVDVSAKLDTEVTLEYETKDGAGNVASVRRTVRIVDTLPPQIELNGSAVVGLRVGGTIIGSGLPFEDGGVSYVGLLQCIAAVSVRASSLLLAGRLRHS